MDILILNWRDIKHPLSGGAEISLFEHAKFWQKNGANVLWFSSSFINAKDEEEIEGIKIIRKGTHHTVHFWAFISFLKGKLGNPQVVIDSFHFIPFFSPLYVRKSKIIALINEPAKNTWFKNIIFPLNLIGFLIEPLFFLFYKNKSFITSSGSIGKELEEYGIKKKNINIVPHGLTLKKIAGIKRDKTPLILFMAQLSKDKGIEDAIRAFSILRRKYKDVRFLVLGKAIDKKYLSEIKKIAFNLKLGNSIKFLGFIPEEKKSELISRSWILVHPSIREGWGLNVIECNAYGVPTVGYNVVGLRDSIQNGRTGILVNKNPQSLSDGVEKLLLDKILYEKMSKQARSWSENFDWIKSGEKSWKVIESTISN